MHAKLKIVSPITVTGLTNETSYTITIKAINDVGSSASSDQSNAVIPAALSGNSDNTASGPVPPAIPTSGTESSTPDTGQSGVNVLANGKAENAGTATTTNRNGRDVTTIVVDQKKMDDKLAAEGQRAVLPIPVSDKSDVFFDELNGQLVKSMEDKQAVLEIRTDKATYTLPAQQINIESVSAQMGKSAALKDIKVQIEITRRQRIW
ncbi:MAG: fibronectin type III domain-containing protein [Cohnella sp.]|nr:fibronectin type III domain-containing protein [Cohnella sp.]